MPNYEFKCKKCGEKFERKLGFFFDRDKVLCPRCGTGDPQMVVSSECCNDGSEITNRTFG